MEILEGVQSSEVKYGVVDVLSLVPYKRKMDEMNIKVMALEKINSGFGMILSGLSATLKHDVEDAVTARSQMIADFMENFADQIPVILFHLFIYLIYHYIILSLIALICYTEKGVFTKFPSS